MVSKEANHGVHGTVAGFIQIDARQSPGAACGRLTPSINGEQRYGPYHPIGGPIPLHRYRAFKKSMLKQSTDRIEALAAQLQLSRDALENRPADLAPLPGAVLPSQPLIEPDPFHEFAFPSAIDAKLAIAGYLGKFLAKLPAEQLDYINTLVNDTLQKQEVMARVREYFKALRGT